MAPAATQQSHADRMARLSVDGEEFGSNGPAPDSRHVAPSNTAPVAASTSQTSQLSKPSRYSDDDDDDDHNASHLSFPTTTSPTPSFAHPHRRSAALSKSYTAFEETALIHKLDRNLTLFLALLYLLSFLDRSNIGNARIAGLSDSLHLSSSQYSWLLTAFYITYILFEPLILCYKFLPARLYIPACVVSWGLVASCQSLVGSFAPLVVLRGALGITEAAFGPGVPFYMTFFYKRRELAYRVGLQISAAPLATSFASMLAWAIVWVNEKVGRQRVDSWRVLFLVEGFPSVLVGVWALWWVPDGPGRARWLSVRERRVAVLRLRDEQRHLYQGHPHQYEGELKGLPLDGNTSAAATAAVTAQRTSSLRHRWRTFAADLKTTLADPKCYLTALMFFSVNVSFASLPVFLPTIINDMQFSALASQGLAAPPYLCAFVFVLVVGHYSDALPDSRSLFLVATAFMSSVSYAAISLFGLFLTTTPEASSSSSSASASASASSSSPWWSIALRYAFIYPAAMGLFASVTLIITWTLNNQQTATAKGVAMTLLNLFGQCGPLVGVRLFPDKDAPGFVVGMAVCAGFMAGVVALALGLRWYLGLLNRRELSSVRLGGRGRGPGPGQAQVEMEMEMETRERLMGRRMDEAEGEDEGGEDGAEDFKGMNSADVDSQRFRFML